MVEPEPPSETGPQDSNSIGGQVSDPPSKALCGGNTSPAVQVPVEADPWSTTMHHATIDGVGKGPGT